IPEQAVVAEHELRAVRGRTLEQLALSRDPRDDSRHLRGAGYLEAVRAVVGERSDLEQVVQVGDDLVALRHPAWHLILRSMAAKPSRTTGADSFIESLMDTSLSSMGAYFSDEH